MDDVEKGQEAAREAEGDRAKRAYRAENHAQFHYRVLSLKDAADAAGISLSTLKRLIAAGALRKVRISEGRVGVFATELAGYLSSRVEDISK